MAGAWGIQSLCESCRWMREVVSAKGSRFLLCRRSADDPRYPKYPPQPITHCPGFESLGEEFDSPAPGDLP